MGRLVGVDQLGALRHIVVREVRVDVVRRVGRELTVGDTIGRGLVDDEDLIAIGAVGEGDPHAGVVERRLLRVEHHEALLGLTMIGDELHVAGLGVGLELVDGRPVGGVHHLDVTAEERTGAGLRVDDGTELDGVEVRELVALGIGTPVVGVLRAGPVVVRDPFLLHEGAGTDGLVGRGRLGRGQLGRGDDVAHLGGQLRRE